MDKVSRDMGGPWANVSTVRPTACAIELMAAVDSGHVDEIPFFANLAHRLRVEIARRLR